MEYAADGIRVAANVYLPAGYGPADKELFLVPGATHIRTYFVPEYTSAITAKLRDFFATRLADAP